MDTIAGCFSNWFTNMDLKLVGALPYLVLWGIWLAHKSIIFEGKFVPPFKISSQCLSLLPFYKNSQGYKQLKFVGKLRVDKST